MDLNTPSLQPKKIADQELYLRCLPRPGASRLGGGGWLKQNTPFLGLQNMVVFSRGEPAMGGLKTEVGESLQYIQYIL